jgi:hypothetical protein
MLCVESPHAAIILGDDFNPGGNGFQQKRLKRHCNLKQIVVKPTRNTKLIHWLQYLLIWLTAMKPQKS